MSSVSRSIPPDVEQNPFSMPLFPDRKLTTWDLSEPTKIEFLSQNLPQKPSAKYELLIQGGITVLYAGILLFFDPYDKKQALLTLAATVTAAVAALFCYTNWSEKVNQYEEEFDKHRAMHLNSHLKQPFTPEMCRFLFSARNPLPRIFYSQLNLTQVLEGTYGDLRMIGHLMYDLNPYVRETLSRAIELYQLKIGSYADVPLVQFLDKSKYRANLLNSADLLATVVWLFKRRREFQNDWESVDRFVEQMTPLIQQNLSQNTLTVKFSDDKTCRVARNIFRDTFLEPLPRPNFCHLEEVTLFAFNEISLVYYSKEGDQIEQEVVLRVANLALMLNSKMIGMSELFEKCQRLTNVIQEEQTNL